MMPRLSSARPGTTWASLESPREEAATLAKWNNSLRTWNTDFGVDGMVGIILGGETNTP